jgi:site-specific recombinase XerD
VIFERPKRSGVWWASYCDSSGKRHRERVGRRQDAVERYHERRREVREGRYLPPRSVGRSLPFRDLATAALEQKKLRLAPLSYVTDGRRLNHLLPAIGSLEAEKISPELLERVFADLRRRGLCGGTVNRYRSLVSSIFSFGVKMRKLRANPIAAVKRYKENECRLRWLREDEEKALRDVIRADYPRREAELDLALYTGMRRGEQFTLKWKDVDLEHGILTVRGKTGRRHIVANSSAIAALRRISRPVDVPSAYVCPETRADGQRDWRRWLEKAAKKAGIEDFHWHDLRHTFASRLVMAGADIRTVQELLGHKSILMTMRYAHLSPDHRQAAAEKIGGAR